MTAFTAPDEGDTIRVEYAEYSGNTAAVSGNVVRTAPGPRDEWAAYIAPTGGSYGKVRVVGRGGGRGAVLEARQGHTTWDMLGAVKSIRHAGGVVENASDLK